VVDVFGLTGAEQWAQEVVGEHKGVEVLLEAVQSVLAANS
jgi:hypothetical protein